METARVHSIAIAYLADHPGEECVGILAAPESARYWRPRVHTEKIQGQAEAIIAGEHPSQVLNQSGSKSARGVGKTTSFWRNLCGDLDPVTIDVWAARAAEGRDWRASQPTGRRYQRIERAYRTAARRRGVAPAVMQATVWIVERGRGD